MGEGWDGSDFSAHILLLGLNTAVPGVAGGQRKVLGILEQPEHGLLVLTSYNPYVVPLGVLLPGGVAQGSQLFRVLGGGQCRFLKGRSVPRLDQPC